MALRSAITRTALWNNAPVSEEKIMMKRTQADLFACWLEHFGAIEARELDLGTLCAIHEWVKDGLAPTKWDEAMVATASKPFQPTMPTDRRGVQLVR
jgi:hypothetical protein